MKSVTRARLDTVIDQAARALGFQETDRRRRTVLRTLVSETLRIRDLDASEPPEPRGTWETDPTPVRYPRRKGLPDGR